MRSELRKLLSTHLAGGRLLGACASVLQGLRVAPLEALRLHGLQEGRAGADLGSSCCVEGTFSLDVDLDTTVKMYPPKCGEK